MFSAIKFTLLKLGGLRQDCQFLNGKTGELTPEKKATCALLERSAKSTDVQMQGDDDYRRAPGALDHANRLFLGALEHCFQGDGLSGSGFAGVGGFHESENLDGFPFGHW